jgi:hypothetical protein
VTVTKESEVTPLLAALRHNVTIKALTVSKMAPEHVLRVRALHAGRST